MVERIKANPRETKLLVIDELGDIWYKEQGLVIKGSQANVIFHVTPERLPCKEEDDCAAVVFEEETQSRGSAIDEERETVAESAAAAATESSGANDCVKNESEEESAFSSPSSPSPSSVTTELKNCVDSKDEKEEASEAVVMQSQAALEPEIVGSDSPAGAVAATSSSDSESELLPASEEKADENTDDVVADQKEDLKEAEPLRVRKKDSL